MKTMAVHNLTYFTEVYFACVWTKLNETIYLSLEPDEIAYVNVDGVHFREPNELTSNKFTNSFLFVY